MKLLVIEDDKLLNNILCYNLLATGYEVDGVLTMSGARENCKKCKYDLIILDVNLPDGSGFDFCCEIKGSKPDIAVVFLTAKDMESDMIKGFEVGADDYVTKPFPISVFQRKVSALLGRIQKNTYSNCYSDGNLYIDFEKMNSTFLEKVILFTPLEYRLLHVMTKNLRTVLTRQVLLEKLWDIDENFVDEHALTSAISRIRNKIEINGLQYIKTVYGMGYMWIGELTNDKQKDFD